MEYRVEIKQIANGWTVEVEATFRNSIGIAPAFYAKEKDAINAAIDWLNDGTTPQGDKQ